MCSSTYLSSGTPVQLQPNQTHPRYVNAFRAFSNQEKNTCFLNARRISLVQMQINATRCSGVVHFLSSSATPLSTKAENERSEACAGSDHSLALKNGSSSSPGTPTSNTHSENSCRGSAHRTQNDNSDSSQFVRRMRIIRQISPISQKSNKENGVVKQKDCLNGYKYRLLRTSQLTNDSIALPVRPIEGSPSATPSTSSQIMEKEEYDIQHLQQQHADDVAREESQEIIPTGIKGILTSKWRTLYQKIGTTQTKSITDVHPVQMRQSSLRSRRSSLIVEEIINNHSYAGFLPDERHNQEEDEEIEERIRVRSVQAASSIDVVAVLSKVFGGGVARASHYAQSEGGANSSINSQSSKKNQHPLSDFFASSPPIRHVFGRTNIIVQLSAPPINHCPPSLTHSVPRYIAIYRFGSVVFFNCTTKESSLLLEQIKKHSVNPIAIGFERREHFEVALQPQLETATGKISADRAMIRELDMNTVGIVSNIMGQTVALDWHNDTVDELLANFSSVNSSVERTGGFTSMERNTLFQVVARNNSLFIDMVGKLGIKDRSDTAWHLSQYEGLHEGMRKEFDLDERFRNVEFKLDLIQQNAKFFLEVLHAQKSNTLEWVIIVLISFECVLMILDMSGWGTQMFSGWSFF